MRNVIKIIILFILISLLLYIPKVNAVTEKQKAVGQSIADFAKETAIKYTDDFVYTYKLKSVTEDNELVYASCVDGIYQTCNYLGVRYSGYIYGSLPKEAGIIGRFENKFAMYCENYALFAQYHGIGGIKLERESVSPKWENLLPGDYVSIDFNGSGHAFIFVDDAGDDEPYTMRISECSGKPALKYGEIKNYKNWKLKAIYRISAEQAETISYNIINSSPDLYDKLDHTPPQVTSVTMDIKTGKINITGEDLKPNNYENLVKGASSIREPISEPANNGIVAYQITTSSKEPIENWIKVEKCEKFNITTSPVLKEGTYYAWVLDVGGNTAYKEITITGENIKNIPLTDIYKVNDNYITGINRRTKLADFRKNMIEGLPFEIITVDEKTLQDLEYVGTNMKLKIENRSDYTLIVTADITGDGETTSTDLLKMKQHIVGLIPLDKNKLMAADIDANNKTNVTDLFKMKRIIVNLDNTSNSVCSHISSSWFIKTEATCTNEGEKILKCSTCNEILKSEKIEKIEHNYVDNKCTNCNTLLYNPFNSNLSNSENILNETKEIMTKESYTDNDWNQMENELSIAIKNAGGEGTRAAVVTAGRYLTSLDYAVPYQSGKPDNTKYWTYGKGLNRNWGKSGYGLDCTSFVAWAFTNGGVTPEKVKENNDYLLANYYSQVRPGDRFVYIGNRAVKDQTTNEILYYYVSQVHISLVIGVDDNYFYLAEESRNKLRVSKMSIEDAKNARTVIRGDNSVCYVASMPEGIVDGNLTNMW